MTRQTIIATVATIGLIGCVIFMIAYHRRSHGNWRRNEPGIWLMVSRVNLGLIFAFILATQIFGDWPLRSETLIVLVTMFALQTFWPSRFIWSSHIYGIPPKEKREYQDTEDT